jgi:DNA-binding SARP family transcriptional activator
MMGTRAPRVAAPIEAPLAEVRAPGAQAAEDAQAEADRGGESGALEAHPAAALRVAVPGGGWPGSPLLRQLYAATVRVRCFGAREVWCGDRLLHIGDPELLLLLAVHPVTGIQSEAVVDALFDQEPTDPRRALRQRCFRLRRALRQEAPDLRGDPLPADASHGERVVCLDPTLVSSDVHEFLELLDCARTLQREAAIEAYGAALALYKGDLLDSSDMPSYRWMYDEGPQVSLTLRSDYRRLEREGRLHLAGLLAEGNIAELGRAEELYTSLCAEDPEDEKLWAALFRVHERAGSSLGLESGVRRLRAALAELSPEEVDIETVPLPPNLDQMVRAIRARIARGATPVS